MTAYLTPHLETRIAEHISSGSYADTDDVIEQVVSLLEGRDRKQA